jgi:RNA polymerase sigma-70 factor (ECF subfamily)
MTQDRLFESVVAQFRQSLHGFFRKRVRNDALADDLLQEVWIKVAKKLSVLPDVERIDAWLYKIARNVLADFYRRQKETAELPPDLPAAPDEASVESLRDELNKYIGEVVDSLEEPGRTALRLTLYEEVPQVELARRLGLSVSAAKSRVQRARAEVRRRMEQCCAWEFDAYGNATACEPRKSEACKQC